MEVLTGFFIIMAHLAVGNLISGLTGNFLPGSVTGMVLLFLSLLTGLVKDRQIRKVAGFLTDNMTIFFLPAFMGIMDLWGMIRLDLWAWLSVMVLTTILVLLAAAYTQEGIERMTSFLKRRKR